jgi:hypothetical protein
MLKPEAHAALEQVGIVDCPLTRNSMTPLAITSR